MLYDYFMLYHICTPDHPLRSSSSSLSASLVLTQNMQKLVYVRMYQIEFYLSS